MEVVNTEPLQPFMLPSFLSEASFTSFLHGPFIFWILVAIFALWALYTIIGIYHWITYSHASSVAIPAISVHIVVSLALMAYALGGALFI